MKKESLKKLVQKPGELLETTYEKKSENIKMDKELVEKRQKTALVKPVKTVKIKVRKVKKQ